MPVRDYCEGVGNIPGIRRVETSPGKYLVTCPLCGKEMKERVSPYGQPYGLTQHRRLGEDVKVRKN